MIQVTKNVSVESGFDGCNLGCVTTKDGIVLIDTPIRPSDAVKWRDLVNKKGEVRYVINTEEHPDHSQSSWFFGGVLVTHQVTREKLAKTPMSQVMELVKHIDPDAVSIMKGFQLRLADITFTGSLTLHLGDHTFRLFDLPGHSTGGIGVYIPEERVVFTTDTVFHHWKSWLQEADPAKWLESLKKLNELGLDAVVPGHGNVCKKDYLDEQASIIRRWVEVVQSAIKKGLSLEEAQAQISPPDPYPKQPKTPMSEPELNKAIIARLYHIYSK